MKKTLMGASLLLIACSMVIMVMPTYTMAFGANGGGRGYKMYQWFDPFLIVYLSVAPIISVICAVIAGAGLIAGLWGSRRSGWVAVPCAIAAGLLAIFGYDENRASFVSGAGGWVAPLLGCVAVMSCALWWIERREAGRAAKSP